MSSDLHRSLEEYLSVRRSLGYKLDSVAPVLRGFVGFAEQSGADTISTELALAWAVQPSQASPIWLAHRLSMVRGFARYLHAVKPATEIPPAGLLCARGYRPAAPYLYSEADVTALMAAAGRLAAPLRAATFQTLIGLLAVTGLRIGEAMRLDRDDIDWDDAVLQVRDSKFGRSREVLCHDSTIAALRAYSARRDQLCPRPSASPSFFVTATGTRLMHNTVYPTFHELVRQTGLHRQSPSHRPRVHDLRHAFAVRTLIRWYRDGEDVEARLPLLSTYLGHANPAATYWYLSAAPELMALALERLERADGQRG